MAASEPEFPGDDYVVRYGLRGFRGALLGLLVWTGFAFVVAAYATAPSIPAAIGLALGELGLLAACGAEIGRAARREILFAVHTDGVYLGSGVLKEDVPWELICAVEIFTERARIHGFRASHRCVGIRVGTRSAYRRMSGWRVDRARLAGAVQRYAPGLPVIDGSDRSDRA
jgi:hypothetical protein